MYSAMRSALLGLRASASQPTGRPAERSCAGRRLLPESPGDRTRAADQAGSLCEGRKDDRDGCAGGGPDLADEAVIAPAHRELQALGGVSDSRLVLRDLHGGLVEAGRGESIDIRTTRRAVGRCPYGSGGR